MTDFFTPRRKALLQIAGATAMFCMAGQGPLSAQSPTQAGLFETLARPDRPIAGGVLAPPCFADFDLVLTGVGRTGSVLPKNLPEAATDGWGGQPQDTLQDALQDTSEAIEPDAIRPCLRPVACFSR